MSFKDNDAGISRWSVKRNDGAMERYSMSLLNKKAPVASEGYLNHRDKTNENYQTQSIKVSDARQQIKDVEQTQTA